MAYQEWGAHCADDRGMLWAGNGASAHEAAMAAVRWARPSMPSHVTATGPGGEAVVFDVRREGDRYVLTQAGEP